ncbi:hypothetical protein ACF06Q_14395 [Streptomyces leeuwenhoekii]|uniref:hypothetical protein n=1 Tax=Streptomyces leeuwenhoekii TaxID=1437453 RepID=UPI003701010D
MPQPTGPASRICPNCDGFASVAIMTGGRTPHGHPRTITVDCLACHGTGTRTVPARHNREGARV